MGGGTLECHEAASVYAILQSKCIILSVVLNVFQGHVIQAQIVFTRLWCEVSCKNLGVEKKSIVIYHLPDQSKRIEFWKL